jgi:hypothetical protein
MIHLRAEGMPLHSGLNITWVKGPIFNWLNYYHYNATVYRLRIRFWKPLVSFEKNTWNLIEQWKFDRYEGN